MTTQPFGGGHAFPGIRTVRETQENIFYWGSREWQSWFSGNIDGATRDAGNTGYETVLRPGLILGRVTSTKKFKEWNPTATDGTQEIVGMLEVAQNMQIASADQDRYMGFIMVGGRYKPGRILIPGETTYGIAGHAQEFNIRTQLQQRFISEDNNFIPSMYGAWRPPVAKTADYTVLASDNGTLFTNRGAAGAVEFTLPATPLVGLRYGFYVVADQTLKVIAGTADTLATFNDAAADSVSFETASKKIGAFVEVVGDGTSWLSIPHTWTDGTIAQTVTIAT